MAYEEKKKMLFDCLQTAEKTIIGTSLEQKESHKGHLPQRNESRVVGRRFQGRESIFKRPAAPISKCLKPRRAPDYQVRSNLIYSMFSLKFVFYSIWFQVNPHKWKKYSLSDADTSDRTNTSAAFAFLKEIEKRKDLMDGPDEDEMDGKITFKRKGTDKAPRFQRSTPLRNAVESQPDDDDIDAKPILKGSKVVMPEYVIGQKSKDRKRKRTSSSTTQKSECRNTLRLEHLIEEEAEDAE